MSEKERKLLARGFVFDRGSYRVAFRMGGKLIYLGRRKKQDEARKLYVDYINALDSIPAQKSRPKVGKFVACALCQKEIWIRPSRFSEGNHFCCHAHNIQWMKQRAFSFSCVICHTPIFTQPAQILHRGRGTCSIVCRSKVAALRAELNARWNPPSEGAIRRRIRYSKKMQEWRKAVFERDNYTCQLCGARNGNGKAIVLNADHIEPFAFSPHLRFDLDNGRTLCLDCHRKTPTWGNRKKPPTEASKTL